MSSDTPPHDRDEPHADQPDYDEIEDRVQDAQDALDIVDELVDGHPELVEAIDKDLEEIEDRVDDAQDHGRPDHLRVARKRADEVQNTIDDLQDEVGFDNPEVAEAIEDLEDAIESAEDEIDRCFVRPDDPDGLYIEVSGETKEAPERRMTPKEILRHFEYDLDYYFLYPVDDVDTTDEPLPGDEEIDLRDRNEFAAVQVDVGYGSTVVSNRSALELDNDVLEVHVLDLADEYDVEVDDAAEANYTHVIIRSWEIPSDGYNKETTDVMIRVPEEYPQSAPDWVYVDEDLRLADGSMPRKPNTDRVDGWLALSWHISKLDGTTWTPYKDDLRWYVETIVRGRLIQGD